MAYTWSATTQHRDAFFALLFREFTEGMILCGYARLGETPLRPACVRTYIVGR